LYIRTVEISCGDSEEEKQNMIKKWSFYISLALIIVYLSSAFKPFEVQIHEWSQKDNNELSYQFPSNKLEDYTNSKAPFTGRSFIGFKEAVAYKESEGKYKLINSSGYMGKYQFGLETLKTIGISDKSTFLNSPKLQEKAFIAFLSKNKWELKDEIEKYSGKIIAGVEVTESGLLAAAHLGGVGSVKKFLESNGDKKCRDSNGASIKMYMSEFGGYETSGIIAQNNPKAN
jgi:hypothetical protein